MIKPFGRGGVVIVGSFVSYFCLQACASDTPGRGGPTGSAGRVGAAGSSAAGGVTGGGAAGTSAAGTSDPGTTGTAGTTSAAGTLGAAGTLAGTGVAGSSAAGQGGGSAGSGAAGQSTAGTTGAAGMGAAGTLGATGAAGAASSAMLDDALKARLVAGMVPLQAWYNTGSGLFQDNDWWTSGNQLTTVIDYTRETGDMKYFADIDNTFQKNKGRNFDQYGFYDDDGWWSLVWIRAYDLTKNQAYLDMAKTIFRRMAGSWDTKCGGGIYWRNAKDRKNAISNELFMHAAAGLHLRTQGDTGAGSFLDWAQRTWTWFKTTGLIRADHLITDSLNGLGTTCPPSGPTFSYNQGVLVGALVELAAGTGDATLLDEAGAIVQATMTSPNLQSNGVMTEPCGIGTKDCWQFKGVFFRALLEYYRVRPAKDIQAYARKQSDSIWNVAKNAQNQFGYQWNVAFDGAASRRQGSALDALLTAWAVSSPLP